VQYLIFTIDKTLYAVDVFHIQEVISYEEPQHLPCPDPIIAGLLSSRGSNFSVVDIRKKFELEPIQYTDANKIVVIDAINKRHGSKVVFGAIVDSVQEVLTLDEQVTDDRPNLGNSIANRFVKSIAKKDDKFVLILDVDKIFSFDELDNIAKTQGE